MEPIPRLSPESTTESGPAPTKPCCIPQAVRHNADSPKPASLKKCDSPVGPAIDDGNQGMVLIPAGSFGMGTNSTQSHPADGEGPVRQVKMDAYYIDEAVVTNAQFEAFVNATGYKTDSEKYGWSFVFSGLLAKKFAQTLAKTHAVVGLDWWLGVPGACWNKPLGPRSTLKGLLDHPVTHVSWNDAMAYCTWAGKKLPSEAQWEYAARGGLEQALYPWGNELTPRGKHQCNIWQGKFPVTNTAEDGYIATCPVKTFAPNGYGLYNVAGNVWEFTADWFSTTWHKQENKATRENPTGPAEGTGRVQKGGSFLCHASYCNRYRVAARIANSPDSSSSNTGFRCMREVK